MKKMLALLLTVCLLLPSGCAQAMTMEQMVYMVLPYVLQRLPEGFNLSLNQGNAMKVLSLSRDESGMPVLLWGETGTGKAEGQPGSMTGVRLDTAIDALLCYAAGVDALPEDARADLGFLGETMLRLEQAVLQSVTVEESDIAQEDGRFLHQTDVTVQLKTLLTLIDEVIRSELKGNADAIDAFFSGYGEILAGLFPGFLTGCDAATLLSLWQDMSLSSLLSVEIPLHLCIVSSGGLAQPWRIEASVAQMRFSAEFTGEYVAGELNTPMKYVFDSRDLGKLWTIIAEAGDGLSEDAIAYSAGNGEYLLRLNPLKLLYELEVQLNASIERHREDWDALLMRYLPWFGIVEADVDEVTRSFRKELSWTIDRIRSEYGRSRGAFRDLLSAVASVPHIEMSLRVGMYSLDFEGMIGGRRAYAHLRNSSVDVMLPIPDYPVTLNGMLVGRALNLSGFVGSHPYALTGVRTDGLWMIDCYVDSNRVAVFELADSYMRASNPNDPNQSAMLLWGRDSVQLITSNGALNVLATADGSNASLTVQMDGDTYAVRLRRGGMLGLELYTYTPRYSYNYSSRRAELTLTDEALSAKLEERRANRRYYQKYAYSMDAGWSFENPYLRMSKQVESDYNRSSLSALDYRPGSLSLIEDGSSLHVFSDTGADTLSNRTHVVYDDEWNQYAWTIDTDAGQRLLTMHVTGDVELDVRLALEMTTVQDAELAQVNMLDAHELLLLLELVEPRVTSYVGVAQGFAGPVTVSVEVNELGKIVSIDIGDEQFIETQGLGALAQEDAFRKQFIGMTLPVAAEDIDGIAGATMTTNAVLEALNAVARDAGFAEPEESGKAEMAQPGRESAEAETVPEAM